MIHASTSSINEVLKTQNASAINLNSLLSKAYYFEDSDGFILKSLDLFYKRVKVTENISVGVDAGIFMFENRDIVEYSGVRYGATLFYGGFSLRLGMNDFEDFSEFVPTLIYQGTYQNHGYTLEYTRQNAIFYAYSIRAYEERIVADHFSLSDYVSFSDNRDLWANITVNMFSNDDREITGQFDWRFFHDTVWSPNFTYHLAIEGWYTTHSKQHNIFYSPAFSDATILRVDPQYIFSRAFGVRARFGVGHSFSDETQPYKYGLWVFGEPANNLSYTAGCLHSNAARLSYGPNYNYMECEANLGYSW